MAVEQWSESVLLGNLSDDPQFTDDLKVLIDQCSGSKRYDVLLNFADVSYLNSSNIAKLLKLRKTITTNERKLRLCAVNRAVWGVFLVTGLDRIFDVFEDVPTGLASLQVER